MPFKKGNAIVFMRRRNCASSFPGLAFGGKAPGGYQGGRAAAVRRGSGGGPVGSRGNDVSKAGARITLDNTKIVKDMNSKAKGIDIVGRNKHMMKITGYQMTAKDAPFEKVELPVSEIKEGEALVEVAGCGVCHTDVSFWHHGVPTRHQLPLILGHEIAGTVIEGPAPLKGKPAIVVLGRS